ncbi:MAG: F0F1 ATP synthase subunit B [Armatimonadetes bacterium]|nr:F0F1 ATP synthase subunit B [Armatimonadota bacterium]
MANQSKSGGANPLVSVIVGVLFMVGGMYLQQQLHGNEMLHSLEEQGIPLSPGLTVATIGVFLILFPVLKVFYFTPLFEAIEGRTTLLERTFTEAEDLRSEMTSMKSDYEKRLTETEASARAQIQAEIKKAQDMRTQLIAEAGERAEEMKKRAQDEINADRERVMHELRLKTVNLTLAATEKVLGENLDDARNRKLIEEFIERAEVPTT